MRTTPLPLYLPSDDQLIGLLEAAYDVAANQPAPELAQFITNCEAELLRRGRDWTVVDGKFTQR